MKVLEKQEIRFHVILKLLIKFKNKHFKSTKDIAENYLEYQKQTIDSFQSVSTPYIHNVNNQFLNNQDYFRRMPKCIQN